jgi:hypothetical protein
MLQRQADAIQAVEHAVAAEIVDLKAVGFIPGFNYLRFQIHFKRNARVGLHQLEQLVDLLVAQGHRQQLVIEAVAVKDIGKARGDNDLKAVIGQRPRRVLARGAAAEVFPRQQYRCPLVLRKIQHELRVRLLTFIVEKAPVVKQVRAKAGAGDLLQKLLRDDRVGIDVCSIQRNHQAGMLGKFLCHDGLLTSDYGYRRNGR